MIEMKESKIETLEVEPPKTKVSHRHNVSQDATKDAALEKKTQDYDTITKFNYGNRPQKSKSKSVINADLQWNTLI